MPHIIVSQDQPHQYYTGYGWSENESEAMPYAAPELAQNVIAKHNMNADIVQTGTDDLDRNGSGDAQPQQD